jgi:hypothetical protein
MLQARPLGKTGLTVSELGFALAGPSAADLAARAAKRGCRLFHVEDPALVAPIRTRVDAVLAGPIDGVEVRVGGPFRRAGAPGDIAEAARTPGVRGVLVPFSFAEQSCAEALPKATRAGLGVIGVEPLQGPEILVKALAPLVKPRRTFTQAALQFALANQHLDSVLVRVTSVRELEEALGAVDAEPLTIPELEKIFETYAHRNDEDPSVGCR